LLRKGRGTSTVSTSTLKNPILDSINSLLVTKSVSIPDAEKLVTQERDRLYDAIKERETLPLINIQLLDDYWKHAYANKDIVDKNTAWHRLLRPITALGALQLPTATAAEIQQAIRDNITNVSSQRDGIAAIRQILTFIGRHDVKLSKPKKSRDDLEYVPLEDFSAIAANLPPEIAMVAWVALATGCRLGEVFALKSINAKYQAVYVDKQMDDQLVERQTKNRRPRWAPILSEGREFVETWIIEPSKSKNRLLEWGKLMRKASGGSINFHSLRHSYAIALLNKGATMEQTARALGDSITTCQEYYAGFVLTSSELEAMKKLL
jgi:integrase